MESVVYFQAIAQRSVGQYIEEFQRHSHEMLAADLLGQAWQNSRILRQKYAAAKAALILLLVAVGPWLGALMSFATYIAPEQGARP
jgi:hypothetical protein